ncbi:MAG: DUF2252 domain-containing protein, partial [Candidatus Eremiobacteraeota bacterium]|nr:DUF2252 domain-containing protein [Candidatus Eremiobacteraeota bacterium]
MVKSLRRTLPRRSFATWKAAADRPDPLVILAAQERGRVADLLPIRHARMAQSPFAFYRGCAAVMAADLARVPVTGLQAQLCGDAHLANFGIFATPERNVIFDVNDFDETLPGPWEWDLMRLTASVPLAAQARGFDTATAADAVFKAVKSYQRALLRYAKLSPLEVWYDRVDVSSICRSHGRRAEDWRRALQQAKTQELPQHFSDNSEFYRRVHAGEPQAVDAVGLMEAYAASLLPSVRVLLKRYRFADLAMKIVGVGSVGTRCYVALLLSERNDALVLQLKEAQASVLEAYLPSSAFPNHGQRVINGQRLMQAASDLFLGWVRSDERDFYIRQLRDMKGSIDLTSTRRNEFVDYASHCGWTLARAHARSGDGEAIAAYLGHGDAFATAMVGFARAYAGQVER